MDESSRESMFADLPMTKQGLTPEAMIGYLEQAPETRELAAAYKTVVELAEKIKAAGGQAFLVGGAVRDEILGLMPKDFDLEVHGLSVTELESILQPYGATASGKSFGTYKLPSTSSSMKIEFALPRRDSQQGDAHNAVVVDIQPHLGLTEAARRREYTIGAIYKDVLTGELYDPFDGIGDLESKTLRIVDPKTFGDDALRVLRGASHAARFGLAVEPETQRMMASMVEKMGALPKERLREEWTKLLIQGERPSLGIEILRDVGVLERWYPELELLWSTAQDVRHHPEGDVGKHTLMVTDASADIAKSEHFSPSETQELMYAALLHDTGKPATTRETKGAIHAYGHEAAGVKPAEIFLDRLGMSPIRTRRITSLIANHMRPPSLYREREKITDRAMMKLARDAGPTHLRTLVALGEADHRGRGPFEQADGTTAFPDTGKYHDWWNEQILRLHLDQPPEQILWGRDLVESERHWAPGKNVGAIVAVAEELAMQGMTREEVLAIIDGATSPEQALNDLRSRRVAEEE